jgi:hypothetical protein
MNNETIPHTTDATLFDGFSRRLQVNNMKGNE